MARIYTRSGDDGSSGLIGGARVTKDHPRLELCGTLDELNGQLGLARAALDAAASAGRAESGWHGAASAVLRPVQEQLFELGAELAVPPPAGDGRLPVGIGPVDVRELETAIDRLDADLPALARFILPGGCPAAAQLHVARAVCRRAERLYVRHRGQLALPASGLAYLNRLSDLLFVLARWVNRAAGRRDEAWQHSTKERDEEI